MSTELERKKPTTTMTLTMVLKKKMQNKPWTKSKVDKKIIQRKEKDRYSIIDDRVTSVDAKE